MRVDNCRLSKAVAGPITLAMRWLALLALVALPLALPAAGAAPAALPSSLSGPPPGFYVSDRESTGRTPESTVAAGPALVSAADPRAAAAGTAMLEAGGNAADAAAATLIALTVVEPQSSGLGGGAFLLWHDAASGRTWSIDAREKAPASARPDRFVRPDGTPMPFMEAVAGGYSVGVPGTLALVAELSRRWGRLPWERLFQPAIALARDGVELTERAHKMIETRRELLAASPDAAAIFLDPSGQPWPVGHRLVQPRLADTLELLAHQGPRAFYEGAVGAEITAAVAHAFAHPATLSADDLRRYRAEDRPPVCRPYRIWRVCSMGPPSFGGIAVLQILGELERFDLKRLGPDNLLFWHLFAEAQRLTSADREAYGADADYAPVPVAGLLSDDYLRERSAHIRLDRAMTSVAPGRPVGATAIRTGPLADIPATTHLIAIDQQGDIASATSTIEGVFGSGLMAGGFMLNNELTDFDFVPEPAAGEPAWNRVQPGKRPRSSMAPTIVYDSAGTPVAVFGAAGGATIIPQVARAIIAWADWGMTVEHALAAPMLYADRRGIRLEQGTRVAGMVAGLKALGHQKVEVAVLPVKGNAAVRSGGNWRGAADPRTDGQAIAIGNMGAEH
jgi:gamma-glutamyltranspeptidase/glutathione hydrolase